MEEAHFCIFGIPESNDLEIYIRLAVQEGLGRAQGSLEASPYVQVLSFLGSIEKVQWYKDALDF